jgi:hypothetical protein
MAFIETPSGDIYNTDHISGLAREAAGHYKIRWIDGRVATIPADDGDAIRSAVTKAKPGRKPKHTVE